MFLFVSIFIIKFFATANIAIVAGKENIIMLNIKGITNENKSFEVSATNMLSIIISVGILNKTQHKFMETILDNQSVKL